MDISVIVLTHNSEAEIKKCLTSLNAELCFLKHEIVVVDNASVDHTVDIIKEDFPHVNLIQNKSNLGVAKARNIGLKQAKGDFLFILDDDTIVLTGGITALLQYIKANADVGLCAPQLLNVDGSLQVNALPYPSVLVKGQRILSKLIRKEIPYTYAQLVANQEPFLPSYVIGAAQLIRKEAFAQVGFLDESIFYGPEDADFCLRMVQKNWKVVCLPYAKIVHTYQRKSYRLNQFKIIIHHMRALLYFWNKHGWFGTN